MAGKDAARPTIFYEATAAGMQRQQQLLEPASDGQTDAWIFRGQT